MMSKSSRHKAGLLKSQDVFFPAACLAAISLSLLSQTARMGITPWAGALTGLGHAHELLFGFVLALVCGYTLGKTPARRLWLMFAVWLSARLAYIVWPGSMLAEGLNILFALWAVYYIAPRYSVAKKWRNKTIAPLLIALFSFPLAWLVLSLVQWPINPQALLQSFLVLLIMLMAFISGRMLAPAFAGELQQQNYVLKERVQPRIEAAILILPPLVAIFLFHSATHGLSALLLVILAGMLLIRMLRWQFWRCWYRSDLMGVIIGQLWLVTGSVLLACALALNHNSLGFIHAVTIGAIGTLSTMVMLKHLLPKRHFPAAVFYPPVILFACAVCSRIYADYALERDLYLLLAVAAWSFAYAWVLVQWSGAKFHRKVL